MARFLNEGGTTDPWVEPADIAGLTPADALPFVLEAYQEADWLVDVLDVTPDGTVEVIVGSPGDGMAWLSRLTP